MLLFHLRIVVVVEISAVPAARAVESKRVLLDWKSLVANLAFTSFSQIAC